MVSELPINAALTAAATAAALTVVLFLYSLGLRLARLLHNKELRRLRLRWWPILAEAASSDRLDDKDGLLDLKHGSDIQVLHEWCRFRSMIKHDRGSALALIADDLGLLQLARRQLRRHSTGDRLVAMRALGFLRDTYSWDRIEAVLSSAHVPTSITAAMALVRISPVKAVHLIIPEIASRNDWPRTQVGRILNLAGPTVVTRPLCQAIESADVEQAIRLLQFYESANLGDVDSLAAMLLLRRTEPNLIAAALKAVRGRLPTNILARLIRHDVWFVRLQAATLLGRCGRRDDYGLLEPMLGDEEWWVRYRAAEAITKLPFLGPHALRKLRDRQHDPFARDIMCQAMAEAGLA